MGVQEGLVPKVEVGEQVVLLIVLHGVELQVDPLAFGLLFQEPDRPAVGLGSFLHAEEPDLQAVVQDDQLRGKDLFDRVIGLSRARGAVYLGPEGEFLGVHLLIHLDRVFEHIGQFPDGLYEVNVQVFLLDDFKAILVMPGALFQAELLLDHRQEVLVDLVSDGVSTQVFGRKRSGSASEEGVEHGVAREAEHLDQAAWQLLREHGEVSVLLLTREVPVSGEIGVPLLLGELGASFLLRGGFGGRAVFLEDEDELVVEL